MSRIPLPARAAQTVLTPGERARVRWFQLQRYHEGGLIDSLPTELPDDPFVETSTYFAVYSPNGDLWGTSRLISADNSRLPLLDDHELDPEYERRVRFERDQMAEISRFAVSKDAPQVEVLAALGRAMFQQCALRQQNTIWLLSIGMPLKRLLERTLGIPCEIAGPVLHNYYNEDSYPVLIDTVRYLHDCRGSRRWAYFTEGITVDLTSARQAATAQPAGS